MQLVWGSTNFKIQTFLLIYHQISIYYSICIWKKYIYIALTCNDVSTISCDVVYSVGHLDVRTVQRNLRTGDQGGDQGLRAGIVRGTDQEDRGLLRIRLSWFVKKWLQFKCILLSTMINSLNFKLVLRLNSKMLKIYLIFNYNIYDKHKKKLELVVKQLKPNK